MTKEEILAAIRKEAEENNGAPLGVDRFANATGIKPYDWGKYWARFGDAQREAGYEPNRPQGALDESYLMEALAGLTIELDHFPTRGEMRLKRISDSAFPTETVFFRRFGSRREIIQKVLEYSRKEPRYKTVAPLLEPLLEVDTAEPEDLDEGALRQGFVYLFKERPGHYKIGVSDDPDRRLYELTKGPYKPELVHKIHTDDPAGVETYWHRRFADRLMRGEWFRLSAADVKAFKRWRTIL